MHEDISVYAETPELHVQTTTGVMQGRHQWLADPNVHLSACLWCCCPCSDMGTADVPLLNRQIIVAGPQQLARPTIEEAAEAAERAASRMSQTYHGAHVLQKQQQESQFETQMELDAHYVQVRSSPTQMVLWLPLGVGLDVAWWEADTLNKGGRKSGCATGSSRLPVTVTFNTEGRKICQTTTLLPSV